MRKFKAITDLISVIILLLITVALAGVAYSFLQGYLFPQVTRAFIIPTGGAYCSNGFLLVYAINTGYQSDILTPNDWIVASVRIGSSTWPNLNSGCPGIACGLTGNTIKTGESKLVINWDCDSTTSPNPTTGLCNSGNYEVDLGTTSGIQHITVFCP